MADENEGKKPSKKFSFKARLPKFRGKRRKPKSSAKAGAEAAKEEGYSKSISEMFREFKEEKLRRERFAILGMGNDLKGDDGVGFYVVDKLRDELKDDPGLLFIKSAAPEDHVREIREFAPTMLIIIDAADFGKRQGSIKIINEYQISESSISTRASPLTLFLKLYQADQAVRSSVVIIGVQRKTSELGQPMSGPVRRAGDEVAKTISMLYRKKFLDAGIEKEIASISKPWAIITDFLRNGLRKK